MRDTSGQREDCYEPKSENYKTHSITQSVKCQHGGLLILGGFTEGHDLVLR